MGGLERRVEIQEDLRKRGEAQLSREALTYLSDAELEALEESLAAEARARGEQPPPNNPVLEEIWEEIQQQEAIEQRRHQAKKGEME